MKFPALSRSLKRAKSSLPKDRAQKRTVVKALFEGTIPVTPRKFKLLSTWSNIYLPMQKLKGKKAFLRDETKEKLDSFLSRNDVIFTLPGRNHQVYVGNDVNGDCQYWTKEYLLRTYPELVVFYKQKMMRRYRPLHFQPCTVMWAQKKNMLVGVRFHRLNAYVQIVKMLSCYTEEWANAMKVWKSQINDII